MCVTGCPCLYSCFYRSKLRGQYFLQERPCTDCCVHCCCEECALCQEYRQLKSLGFDPSIGPLSLVLIIVIHAKDFDEITVLEEKLVGVWSVYILIYGTWHDGTACFGNFKFCCENVMFSYLQTNPVMGLESKQVGTVIWKGRDGSLRRLPTWSGVWSGKMTC